MKVVNWIAYILYFFFPLFPRDLPCTMSLIEIKSLFRMDDIIASATQPITTLELSARSGQGLQEVLSWLESIIIKWTITRLLLMKWCYSHRTLNDGFKHFSKRCQYPWCAKPPFLRGFNYLLSFGLTEKVARHMTRKTVNVVSLVPYKYGDCSQGWKWEEM